MKNTAAFYRSAIAISLLLTAGLMVVSTLLAPEFPADPVQRLASIHDGGISSTISAVGFTLAQLPFIVAMLGVAQLLRSSAPILSILAGGLGLLGGFGHAVFGGISILTLAMAADTANHELHSALLLQVEEGPAVIFMAMGLLGTVLGILFLAIGLWRAHVGPRWLPFVLFAFLIIEFIGTNFSEFASIVSGLLYLGAFAILAAIVWTRPRELEARGAAMTRTSPAEPQSPDAPHAAV